MYWEVKRRVMGYKAYYKLKKISKTMQVKEPPYQIYQSDQLPQAKLMGAIKWLITLPELSMQSLKKES